MPKVIKVVEGWERPWKLPESYFRSCWLSFEPHGYFGIEDGKMLSTARTTENLTRVTSPRSPTHFTQK